LNLIDNAIEAGADVIGLRVEADQQNIEIRIQDNGKGIDTAGQKQLFEPFYTTKIHGTGLGLAVVESVVKAHAGSVKYQSQLTQGSLFILTLPIIEPDLGLSLGGSQRVIQEKHHEAV
jgi:two-component system, sensor histidine kinase FlrB